MATHCGYIVKIDKLRPHSNADRLQIATFFGNDVCISLDNQLDDIGVYFPTDLQLSEEFCVANDLVRRKDENGNPAGGFLEPGKRNVKCIKLRGEKSDGLYLPISCFDYLNLGYEFKIGDTIDVIDGHEICCKYIPRSNKKSNSVKTLVDSSKKTKMPYAPLFKEHIDTEQLAYNLADFHSGDLVEITLKMHGTSQRTAHLPVFKGYKETWLDKVNNWLGKFFNKAGDGNTYHGTPIYDWDYVTGTRRTVIEDFEKKSYYDSNDFRKEHAEQLKGKLHKGETVYYEVVGFQTNGVPIMPSGNNAKTNDPEFIKQFGKTTVFSYGCHPGGLKEDEDHMGVLIKEPAESAMYVYRMSMMNEDGVEVDYTPDYMRYRCEQMGVNCVPVLWKGYIPEHCASEADDTITPGEWIFNVANRYVDGADPIGKTHLREGVVVRIINRPKFKAYKQKSFHFKCIEGLIKETSAIPDIEEAEAELSE